MKRLESGELAAYFADRAILSFLLIGPDSPKNLMIAKDYLTREPYALALARGDDDFRLLVDRTLARLYRSPAIDKIFARNFANAKPSDVLQRALHHQRAAGVDRSGQLSQRPAPGYPATP